MAVTFDEFLRYAVATSVNGGSGEWSRRDLPSLEEPAPGTACEACGYELRVVGYCPDCAERGTK